MKELTSRHEFDKLHKGLALIGLYICDQPVKLWLGELSRLQIKSS